ncbi:phosphatase and actin regulator 2-like isoform X4 [Megalops cyprinoides]|uniref:phosphatase and actin regulator 2-like isoform X4 n=1 Tax=Megalops cyprinoides TaxID=118141 RepID=UPI001865348A|nr:phosphatase and actin regulator 2-like isoform X4 [Megalops cyprinoides]
MADKDFYSDEYTFSAVRPLQRVRSQSDTSGFRARILNRLHAACSVDGLQNATHANLDAVITDAQSPPLKRGGKLSSLGKIFKPWKWRKKKTSDKFQDLSKVLERKISTRQTREELIRKGVLIPEQDSEEPISSNGHTAPISMEPVTEEVQVDIEVQSDTQGDADDKTAKSSHPKKLTAASKSTSQPTPLSASATQSRDSKERAVAKSGVPDPASAEKKRGKHVDTGRSVTVPKAVPEAESPLVDGPELGLQEEVPVQQPKASAEENPVQDSPSLPGVDSQSLPVESGEDLSNSHSLTEDICFTESPSKALSDCPKDPLCDARDGDGEGRQSGSTDSPAESSPQPKSKPRGMEDEQKARISIPDNPEVTVIPDDSKECHTSDSDSDGPILYRDGNEDDEEDEYTSSSLSSKIRRRDTLAIKLGNRPSKRELEEKNILPRTSEVERQELRQQIGCRLVRRLSQRPTTEELEQRNILKQKNEEEEHEAKQEIKRRLTRKLSVRPTVAELVARRILRFNEYVEVTDAKDYDRRADKPWTRLTPADKAAIRKELNEFKSKEMEVHEESKQFTRFHRP